MKSIINRHSAVWQKFAGFSLAIMIGLVAAFPNTAEARLIFTTEDDGVNADAYHLDNDDSSADFIDLGFGTGLTNRLRYDIVGTQFLLNRDLNLEGNALKDFRVENAAAALTCAAAGDKGRMYYDTTTDDLFFCDGTTWVSTSTSAAGLDGDGLVVNGGTGKLDVNVDGTTLEVSADVVQVKAGGIDTTQLADNAVTSAKIADGTITAADLGTDSVGSDEIAANAVTTAEIAADTIVAGDIATGAVTTDEILNGTIETADINLAGFTIGSGQITDGSLTAADLGTDSVDSDEIAANAVGASELADNAVDSAAIQTGAVTTTEILDGTIATIDMADGAVNSAKILDGTITTTDMAAGANDTFLTTDGTGNVVWELKSNFMSSALASGSMWVGDGSGTATAVAMSGDVTMDNTGATTISNDAVTTAKILDANVTTAKLADDSVTAVKINADVAGSGLQQNAGTGALEVNIAGISDGTTIEDNGSGKLQLVDGSVTTAKLADNSVNSAKIVDGSITAADLGTDSVDSDEIAANAVGASELADNAVDAAAIQTGAVTTTEILDGTVAVVDLNATGAGNNKTLTTDGTGAMVWVDDAAVDREVSAHVAPEFSNFTLRADGTNNKGTLESDHDTTAKKNYYKWKTRKTANMQDYDVVFQWMVPDDFQSWTAAGPSIEVDYKTDTTVATDNKLDITMTDTAGAAVALAGNTGLVSSTADTWVEDASIAAASLAGTYTPGEYVTITVKMSSKATTTANRNPAYLGAFNFNYVAK